MRITPTILAILISSLALPGFLFAAAPPAGRVIISLGSVSDSNNAGVLRSLKRGDNIFSGETIKTGENSKVQLRFTDDTLVALDEATEFKVKNYQLSAQTADKVDQYMLAKDNNAAANTEKRPLVQKKTDLSTRPSLQPKDQMIVALAKGGLRMVTGAIVKTNPDAYQVGTVVGTIGVRGTELEVQANKENCQETKIKVRKGDIFIKLLNNMVINLGPASLYTVATFSGNPARPNVSVQINSSSPPVPVNMQTGTVSDNTTSVSSPSVSSLPGNSALASSSNTSNCPGGVCPTPP